MLISIAVAPSLALVVKVVARVIETKHHLTVEQKIRGKECHNATAEADLCGNYNQAVKKF